MQVQKAIFFIFGQPSFCSKCGKLLFERKRKPCPRCGELPRTHQRFAYDSIGAKDRAG